jgi:glycosyltransferase domain-containing protein
MMEPLDQLTLVIPTLNRPEYVHRQVLHWWEHPIHLLVVDGSPDPPELPAGGKCQIRHVKQEKSFQERMTLASRLVETPFVALCGDDDLYLASGLSSCLEMLKLRPRLIGGVGPSVRFSVRSGSLYAEPINWGVGEKRGVPDNGLSRMAAIYDEPKLDNPMYGVYRAPVWKLSVQSAYERHYASAYAYEFLLLLLMSYQGFVGVHQKLMWLSSAENPSTMTGAGFNRSFGNSHWLKDAAFAEEVALAKSTVAEALSRLGIHQISEIMPLIDQCFSLWRRRYEFKGSRLHRWKLRFLVRRLLPFLPSFLKMFFRDQLPPSVQALAGSRIFAWSTVERRATPFGIKCDERELQIVARTILGD